MIVEGYDLTTWLCTLRMDLVSTITDIVVHVIYFFKRLEGTAVTLHILKQKTTTKIVDNIHYRA